MAQDASRQRRPAQPRGVQDDWPISGTLKDGSTFTLKQSIQDKLALNSDDDPANDVNIEYLFNYGSASIPLFSPQYLAGFQRSIPEAQAIMPRLSGTPMAPASAAPGPQPPDRPDLGALGGRPDRLPVHPDHR